MKKMLLMLMLGLVLTGCGGPTDEDQLDTIGGIVYVIDEVKPFTGEAVGYYDNGKIEFMETYKNGILHGKQIYYYGNGQIKSETTYKFRRLDGKFIIYEEDGSVDTSRLYDYGKWIRN